MRDSADCPLSEGFGVWEKTWAQASFWAIGIAGTVGIVLADWVWVLPYLVIYWYGIPGVVMRHTNCPRCPHLHEFGDCLQAPPAFARRLVKTRKDTPFSGSEKFLFLAIFILIPTYPVYWLLPRPAILITFLVGVGMWYGGQFFRFCKRCRVSECPFNRVRSTQPGVGSRVAGDEHRPRVGSPP